MFDFLAEDDEGSPARKKPVDKAGERPLPIIRKPVPVSRSGPLLPPKPGAPVEPPPELTTSTDKRELDLNFLDEGSSEPKITRAPDVVKPEDRAQNNVTRLDPRSRRTGEGAASSPAGTGRSRPVDTSSARPARQDAGLGSLDLDDSLALDEDWHRPVGVSLDEDDEYEGKSGRGRWLAMVLALLFIAAGVGSFVLSSPPAWLKLPGSDPATIANGVSGTDVSAPSDNEAAVEYSPSPMMQKFRAEQERLEQLVAAGSLDEAEEALATMDRSLYGYGANEFMEIENRIDQLRSGTISAEQDKEQVAAAEAARLAEEQEARNEAARLTEAQAASEEAARLAEEQAAREEAARLTEAQDAREEAARLAEAQAARAEAARLAEAQAAREEAARLAEAQAAREEAARLAQAQAAREEAARLAQTQASRAEAARLAELEAAREEAARRAEEQAARIEQVRAAEEAARAEAQRLAQSRSESDSAATSALAGTSTIDRDRIATDKRIAEERAALQRQQAREQRLIEARQREAQAEQARGSAQSGSDNADANWQQVAPSESDSAGQASETVASASQVVSDADLQLVYQRFVNLQQAISQRDINAVVSLTQRSGVRVQQFMQMFENSTAIDARIKNVSTSNATGEIKGTLQINRVQRANGTYVKPPASLSSIALSSKRDEDGWSAISW